MKLPCGLFFALQEWRNGLIPIDKKTNKKRIKI